MTLTQEQQDAIAAILSGTAPAAPVQSAPVAPVVASPFAAAGKAASTSPAAVAMRLFPQDRAAQRRHISTTLEPGYTCSVDTTATLADGTTVPSALHGFTVRKESGIACPGIFGLPKDTACPGTIR